MSDGRQAATQGEPDQITLWLHAAPQQGECPNCGFDSLVLAKGLHVTTRGVSEVMRKTICGRCTSET